MNPVAVAREWRRSSAAEVGETRKFLLEESERLYMSRSTVIHELWRNHLR
jgi:hypothetical protein